MTWRFSDGTTVELGGTVEGASIFGQQLRSALTEPQWVGIWPPPTPAVPLDPNDVALLDHWLEARLQLFVRIRRLPLRMTERPADIPDLPEPPWANAPPEPGAIY